ncbi:hypothetical protein [Xenorhabdus sp. SGI246]
MNRSSPESRNSHRHENVKKLTLRNVTTLPLDGITFRLSVK